MVVCRFEPRPSKFFLSLCDTSEPTKKKNVGLHHTSFQGCLKDVHSKQHNGILFLSICGYWVLCLFSSTAKLSFKIIKDSEETSGFTIKSQSMLGPQKLHLPPDPTNGSLALSGPHLLSSDRC